MFKFNDNAKWDSRLAMDRELFEGVASLMRSKEFNLAGYAERLAKEERYASGKGDLAMRVRWDAFWLVFKELRNGELGEAWRKADLNDAQIDSALRRIVV